MYTERNGMELSYAGPLLGNLIRAHEQAEAATAYPGLAVLVDALAERCEELDSPLVWPVGGPAERVAGAAVLSSEGAIRVRGWVDGVAGEKVLLVAVGHVSPLELVAAARHARAMGADQVHACGVDVAGLNADELGSVFDSRSELVPALVPA
jgi:hypothetical protein